MRSLLSTLEPLEARIAPASLLDGHTLAYTDHDGDLVKIIFSKDLFTGTMAEKLSLANQLLKFDTGTVDNSTTVLQQLQLLDLTRLPTIAATATAAAHSSGDGLSFTILATQAGGGNGQVDVGAIKATGVALGSLQIGGDLGQIDAGTTAAKIGLASLRVKTLGARGVETQAAVASPSTSNPAPDLVSTITGKLGTLFVENDLKDARVSVVNGLNSANVVTAPAEIGSITIGGALRGRTAVESASDKTGEIDSAGKIGTITIGTAGSSTGGIFGGGGRDAGTINAKGTIGAVVINGDVQGGGGANSGGLYGENSVTSIKVTGSVLGGTGDSSGRLVAFGNLGLLTIGDDVRAGAGPASGVISVLGTIARGSVTGDINGTVPAVGSNPAVNAGANAGGIFAGGYTNFTLGGNIIGGPSAKTGYLESNSTIALLSVGNDVLGGAGDGSGSILAGGSIANVTINGDLTGGSGFASGVLRAGSDYAQTGDLVKGTILGVVAGSTGTNSGSILAGGGIGSLQLGTKTAVLADVLAGGAGAYSGSVAAHGLVSSLLVNGHVHGGGGLQSGAILTYDRTDATTARPGDLGTVKILGNLVGSTGQNSGAILAAGNLASLTAGNLIGEAGVGSGTVRTGLGQYRIGDATTIRLNAVSNAATTPGSGSASILIGGSLANLQVASLEDATVRAGRAIASLTVTGSVTDTLISARGAATKTTTDVAIGKINVSGSVTNTDILAGYSLVGSAVNPDAQIGAVVIKGAFAASNLIAGAGEGTDAGFGNAGDAVIAASNAASLISRIASLTVGSITGTAAAGEHFGIVAQAIGSVKVGSTTLALTSASAQVIEVPGTANVTVRELALA